MKTQLVSTMSMPGSRKLVLYLDAGKVYIIDRAHRDINVFLELVRQYAIGKTKEPMWQMEWLPAAVLMLSQPVPTEPSASRDNWPWKDRPEVVTKYQSALVRVKVENVDTGISFIAEE